MRTKSTWPRSFNASSRATLAPCASTSRAGDARTVTRVVGLPPDRSVTANAACPPTLTSFASTPGARCFGHRLPDRARQVLSGAVVLHHEPELLDRRRALDPLEESRHLGVKPHLILIGVGKRVPRRCGVAGERRREAVPQRQRPGCPRRSGVDTRARDRESHGENDPEPHEQRITPTARFLIPPGRGGRG